MSESEFLERIDATLIAIETAIDDGAAPIESSRSGDILTLEFDDGSKIIVNSQVATRELWVAARSGGFHYRFDGQHWQNTRDGSELFAALSRMASQQAGSSVDLSD